MVGASLGLIVGVMWEIFELKIRVELLYTDDYFFDTITDLGADILGALSAAIYFITKKYYL